MAGISGAERLRAEYGHFGQNVTGLRPESIDTHECVWERYTDDWLRTSVSTYWYKAEGLITLTTDEATFLGVTYANQGEVRAKGLGSLEAQMRLKWQSQALVSYALQHATDQETDAEFAELAPPHAEGADQRARADEWIDRVRGGTLSQQPEDSCRLARAVGGHGQRDDRPAAREIG